MKSGFDKLANTYALLERLSFGSSLQKTRERGLQAIDTNRPTRALLLGDGDGRFAAAALARAPRLIVESVDSSEVMLETARSRIQKHAPRGVDRYIARNEDALSAHYSVDSYDLIVAQFFFDCFSSDSSNRLIRELQRALRVDGKFVYADFAIPRSQPWKSLSRCVVWSLYRFFRLATSLPARRLPRIQWPDTLTLENRQSALKGLLVSEIRINRPNRE